MFLLESNLLQSDPPFWSTLKERENRHKSISAYLPPRAFYDRVAPYYDSVIMAPFKRRFTNEMETEFLSTLFPEGAILLDLGSGTGRSMVLLQQRSYQVYGIDISPAMVRKAVERGVRRSIVGDLNHLPFQSDTFDGAFSMHGGFSHLPTIEDKMAALKEIERTLKRKCVLMIDVPSPYKKDRGETYIVEWQAGDEKIRLKGHTWYPEQFEEMCGGLGFSETKLLGDYSLGQKFDQRSRRLVLVAKRR